MEYCGWIKIKKRNLGGCEINKYLLFIKNIVKKELRGQNCINEWMRGAKREKNFNLFKEDYVADEIFMQIYQLCLILQVLSFHSSHIFCLLHSHRPKIIIEVKKIYFLLLKISYLCITYALLNHPQHCPLWLMFRIHNQSIHCVTNHWLNSGFVCWMFQ